MMVMADILAKLIVVVVEPIAIVNIKTIIVSHVVEVIDIGDSRPVASLSTSATSTATAPAAASLTGTSGRAGRTTALPFGLASSTRTGAGTSRGSSFASSLLVGIHLRLVIVTDMSSSSTNRPFTRTRVNGPLAQLPAIPLLVEEGLVLLPPFIGYPHRASIGMPPLASWA